MENIEIIDDNNKFYRQIKADLEAAKKSIYLETYIFNEDLIGTQLRDILTKKAAQGLDVMVLLDGIGALYSTESFFDELIQYGGKVRFFRRLMKFWWSMQKMVMRDHRKLLVIDEKVSYIGSSNIDQTTINWLELNARVDDQRIAKKLKEYFLHNFELANENFFKQRKITEEFVVDSLEIIEDSPSLIQNPFRQKFIHLLQKSQKKVLIESPYVIVDKPILKLFAKTIARGVEVTLIIPQVGDHLIVDALNKRFAGMIKKLGVDVRVYTGECLHSKLTIIDGKEFIFGSSNLDYLSFYKLFEINLAGDNDQLGKKLVSHFSRAYAKSKPFDLEVWQKRPIYIKALDWLLYRLRFVF